MGYFRSLDKKECCACSACLHLCPVHAIYFKKDNEGFDYPFIDKDICINCGLCERVCPVEHPQYINTCFPDVYAAVLKSIEERKRSTSGGLFYAISEWVLNRNGLIYGAAFDKNHQVKHIEVDNFFDLQALRGSKYVQSALDDVYKRVKENLIKGKWCYFVGTGCQVAGLKAFLRRDYETLVTSDIVCHGVPSQWLYDQHISFLENKYHGIVVDYHFRNNEKGSGGESFIIKRNNGKIKKVYNPSYDLSPYLYSFMYGMTSRYSCYQCKFAQIPRQGDITLADYWGVKEFFPDFDSRYGVSLCLVNSLKGQMIWDIISDFCYFRKSSINDAAKNNWNLTKTSIPHPSRSYIYERIKNEGYKQVATEDFKCNNSLKIRILEWINQHPFATGIIKALSYVKHRLIKK